MHQLVRRLGDSAPEASEALKVVAYFDVLISRDAGLDSLLRGAAMLAGTAVGAEFRGRTTRRGPDGGQPSTSPLDEAASEARVCERSGESWRVWLEREGGPQPNDEVIAERLAFGVALLARRRGGERGIELALDVSRPASERLAVLAQYRIDAGSQVRLVATFPDSPSPAGPSAIVPTRFGLLRATLAQGGVLGYSHRIGLGIATRADEAPASWDAAVVALQLTDDASVSSFDASELGSMLQLVLSYDPRHPHADVLALAALDDRSREVLLALVEAESLRSAATALGMHHSTVQGRHESLTKALGYDPRSTIGRMRYIAAGLLYRFTDSGPSSS